MSAPDKDLPKEIAENVARIWIGDNGSGPTLADLRALYGYNDSSFERQIASAIWRLLGRGKEKDNG